MTTVVSVHDAEAQLSALLKRVEAGEEIVISRHGRSVARLAPIVDAVPSRAPGRWKGQIQMAPDSDESTEQDEKDWYGE